MLTEGAILSPDEISDPGNVRAKPRSYRTINRQAPQQHHATLALKAPSARPLPQYKTCSLIAPLLIVK